MAKPRHVSRTAASLSLTLDGAIFAWLTPMRPLSRELTLGSETGISQWRVENMEQSSRYIATDWRWTQAVQTTFKDIFVWQGCSALFVFNAQCIMHCVYCAIYSLTHCHSHSEPSKCATLFITVTPIFLGGFLHFMYQCSIKLVVRNFCRKSSNISFSIFITVFLGESLGKKIF